MAADKESLIVRLRAACNGHPCATIAWPHRILREAADRITELEHQITNDLAKGVHSCHAGCARPICAALRRIAHLEALLGEAPHSPGCRMFHAMYGGSESDARAAGSLCDCFKGRVGG